MFISIQTELKEIFSYLEKDYQLKAGHLSKFIPDFELEEIDRFLRPALVVLPAKLFRGYDSRARVLAEIVQIIFLSQEIHNRIPDECAKDAPQFPVLVGDYLFSKFFKKLSDHDLLEWLAPLSSVICEMNEGGILRWEVLERGLGREEDYRQVLLQEHGLISGLACRIGGTIAGCPEETAEALAQFGLNLGMAWGVIKEKFPLAPLEFLYSARRSLLKIPYSPEREAMRALIDEMEKKAFTHQAARTKQKSAAVN